MGKNRVRRRPQKTQGGGERNYALVSKTNESYETYYKAQGLVPADEWDSFMEALRSPLPSTFRITGFKRQAQQLLDIIKSDYFDNLFNIEVDGRSINPPKCLPWYPQELAWQMDLDRKSIRHCEPLKKLHQFLVQGTESGNLSRQEAVSMIPPLVMDVQSHHKVLDMCAAPGSKTAQLLEMLHAAADDSVVVPDGCVVANDSDNKRCYLMTHQVKRLETPSFMIINQDATCMPNFKLPNDEGHMRSVKFDRILADVPCSGDGTLRKNVDAWAKWNTHTGMNLHNIQSRILSRGLEMLEVGGRLVYSTCSLNPTEDEAVISNLLRKSQGAVQLVDVSDKLPGLRWVPGVSTWKIFSRDLQHYDKVESVPENLKSTIRPSVFPPTEEEAEKFQLHKCMRILPHHQDTGGFFIGVLEKTEELPWVKHVWFPPTEAQLEAAARKAAAEEGKNDTSSVPTADTPENPPEGDTEQAQSAAEGTSREDAAKTDDEKPGKRPRQQISDSPPQRKRRLFGYKEDPFIFIKRDDPIVPPINDFFGLDNFPIEQLLVRCVEGKKRNIYFTSSIIKSLVTHNIDRIKIINLGLKILSRSDSQYVSCPFRTVQDGILVLFPHVSKRVANITKDDVITLLSTEMPFFSKFSALCQDQLSAMDQGSVIFVYDPTTEDCSKGPKGRMILCGWLGKASVRSFIPVNDRGHYLRMCGAELQVTREKVSQPSDQKKNNEDVDGETPERSGMEAKEQSNETRESDDDQSQDSPSQSENIDGNGASGLPDENHDCDDIVYEDRGKKSVSMDATSTSETANQQETT